MSKKGLKSVDKDKKKISFIEIPAKFLSAEDNYIHGSSHPPAHSLKFHGF